MDRNPPPLILHGRFIVIDAEKTTPFTPAPIIWAKPPRTTTTRTCWKSKEVQNWRRPISRNSCASTSIIGRAPCGTWPARQRQAQGHGQGKLEAGAEVYAQEDPRMGKRHIPVRHGGVSRAHAACREGMNGLTDGSHSWFCEVQARVGADTLLEPAQGPAITCHQQPIVYLRHRRR